MKPVLLFLGALSITVFFPLSAVAQHDDDVHPFLTDKYWLKAGVYFPSSDFEVAVNGTLTGEHQEVDFEEAVGIGEDNELFSAAFRWNFGKKWSLWMQYFETNNSGAGELTEDVEWEDLVFREGTFAGAGTELKVARVYFGREFHPRPRSEIGFGGGFHWLQLGAFIEGEAFVGDESTGHRRESVETEFPLPNIGAWYLYSWSGKWVFESRVDWLYVDIGDYAGGLWDVSAGVNFQPFDNFGIGLEWLYLNLNVDIDKSDWRGSADLTYSGPYLSVSATW
jgi:hypothetical protein